jgi:uncharacterized membrane protein YeiB
MKSLLLLFSLILFLAAGCSDIKQMNANMEQSNQTVTQNTNTVQHSSEVIQKNSQEIARSTMTMTTIGIFLILLLIAIAAVIGYPTFVLIRIHRKLHEEIKHLVEKIKKII